MDTYKERYYMLIDRLSDIALELAYIQQEAEDFFIEHKDDEEME